MMVRRIVSVCALCLAVVIPAAAPPLSAQFIPGGALDPYGAQYGDPVEVPLADVVRGFAYNKKAVITHGVLDVMDNSMQYYRLRDEGAVALILSVYGAHDDVRRLVGREVEVTGLVREVPYRQECCQTIPRCILDSECEDPSLPPLPSLNDQGKSHWPHVSVTIWGITDMTPPPGAEKREYKRASLESLVLNPGERDGQTVRVVGQFRGRNLYGDLPSRSQRQSSDWVIKDDAFAAWVSGKRPKGPGWELDPALKRDAGRWVEVVGRVETRNGITYLKAVQVALASPPSPAVEADAPPPPERPRVPPVVVFALPPDGDDEVAADSLFQIQFSKDMDETTFENRVMLRYAGPVMPGDRAFDGLTLIYDAGRRALTVDPRDVLRPGRAVELLLLPGILDVDGLPLAPRPGRPPGSADATMEILTYVIGG